MRANIRASVDAGLSAEVGLVHTEHRDGSLIETFANGRVRTTFSDGVTIDAFANGVSLQTNASGSTIETNEALGSVTTTKASGVKIVLYKYGNSVQTMVDGTTIATRGETTTQIDTDGTRTVVVGGAAGTTTSFLPSGVTIERLGTVDAAATGVEQVQIDLHGVVIMTYADGSRVQFSDPVTIESRADGTSLERRADGVWWRTEDEWDSTEVSFDHVMACVASGASKVQAARANAGLKPLLPCSSLLSGGETAGGEESHPTDSGLLVAPPEVLREERNETTGTVATVYEDGTRVETKSSGTTIRIYDDGRAVQTSADGVVIETFAHFPEPLSLQTDVDGTRIVTRGDGSSETYLAGGVVISATSSGIVVQTNLDGTRIKTFVDGTVVQFKDVENDSFVTLPDGTKSVVFPDGSGHVTDPDGTKRAYEAAHFTASLEGHVVNQ